MPREFAEDAFPDAALSPSNEAVIDRFRRPVLRWAITLTTATLDHVQNAADYAPVVNAFLATNVSRQKWLYRVPLLVTKPKQIGSHRIAPNQLTQRISNRFRRQ
jgi:hypothetical protein